MDDDFSLEDQSIRCPMWVDNIPEKDRDTFLSGYEFCMVIKFLRTFDVEMNLVVHKQNVTMLKAALIRYRRIGTITPVNPNHDTEGKWVRLKVEKRSQG